MSAEMTLTPERIAELRYSSNPDILALTDLLAERDGELARLRLFNGQVNRDLFGAIAERDELRGDVARLEDALASALAEVMTLHGKVAAVEALELRWADSTLHGKERGEPWVDWLVNLVRDLRTALAPGGDS